MKTITLALALSTLISTTQGIAQCPIEKGKAQLNAGVGLSSWGIPVYVGLDYGVHKDITIGAEVSYRSYNDNYANNKYSHSIIGISGNGNYHFNSVLSIPTKWDLYAGLNIGYYVWNSSSNYPGNNTSGLGLGAQLGGRYWEQFFPPLAEVLPSSQSAGGSWVRLEVAVN